MSAPKRRIHSRPDSNERLQAHSNARETLLHAGERLGWRSTLDDFLPKSSHDRRRSSLLFPLTLPTPSTHPIPIMSTLLRMPLFGLYGLWEFTRGAFHRHAASFHPADLDVSLHGQTAVVTGANSGTGYHVAKELYRRGACVYMVCRDAQRGNDARMHILRQVEEAERHGGSGDDSQRLKVEIVDISRPNDVASFAKRVFGRDGYSGGDAATSTPLTRLDILVNNAGVLNNAWSETSDGVESSYATNALGTYHITQALLPSLLHTAKTFPKHGPPRVITVSSGAAYAAVLSPDAIHPNKTTFDGMSAGVQQKRFLIEMTRLWARRYPDVHFSVTHPGWAMTPGVETSLPWMAYVMHRWLRTPEQGADTMVWLALKQRGENGAFWFDRAVARRHLLWTEVGNDVVQSVESQCRLHLDNTLGHHRA